MLQNIRDNAQGVVAKTIIGLIIVIFSAAGIDSLLGGSGTTVAAEVNGEEVTAIELDRAVQMQKRRLLQAMGDSADPTLLDDQLIKPAALEQLIQQKLLLQAASDYGLAISPQAIDQVILSQTDFHVDGKFSPELYQNVLRNNGFSMAFFKSLLENDVLIRQISSAIVGSEFITKDSLSAAVALINQQRSFDYLRLPLSSEISSVTISEASLLEYYQEHTDEFQREEKLKLSYIPINKADFIEPVSEDAIDEAYELAKSQFQSSESRKAAHILLEINDQRDESQTQQLGLEILEKIKAGESFASLAETYSDDLGSALAGGDLGYSEGDTFPESFEEALFALQLNNVSDLVKTEAGFHIVKLTEIKAEVSAESQINREDIKRQLELADAEKRYVLLLEQLRDLVFNSSDLKGPAKELALDVKESDWFGRSDQVEGLNDSRVRKAMFSEDVYVDANNSDVIELSSDAAIVLRVVDKKPAEVKPFAEVAEEISQLLKAEKAKARLAEQAAELMELLQQGDLNMAELAEQQGIALEVEENVSRSTIKADRELAAAIFALPKTVDEVALHAISLVNGDKVIVNLRKVVDANVSDLETAEQQAINQQLLRASASQSLQAYEQSIKAAAEIERL